MKEHKFEDETDDLALLLSFRSQRAVDLGINDMTEHETPIELKPELLVTEEAWDAMDEMQQKYRHLVWYVRHNGRKADEKSWEKIPGNIKQGALKAAALIEKDYPDEVNALRDEESSDWTHGFNSAFSLLYALR